MKKLINFVIIAALLLFVVVLVVSRREKNIVQFPTTKAADNIFMLNGTIKCEIIQRAELYTRVATDTIVTDNDLKVIADSLKLSETVVYFHIPGFPGRGEEYATYTSSYSAGYGDFDTVKLKQTRVEGAIKEAEQIRKSGRRDEDFARNAFVMSQHFVKEQLISPKSADFPLLDYKFSNVIDNTIVIESYVDAKNAYNAEIRHNYSIKLKKVGSEWNDVNSWQVISLNIN